MPEVILDCKGLPCPLPLIKISRALKRMAPGQQLTVEATDSVFHILLKAWTSQMNYKLVEVKTGEIQRAVIQNI